MKSRTAARAYSGQVEQARQNVEPSKGALEDQIAFNNLVEPDYACPSCGNRAVRTIIWRDDFEKILCVLCGAVYEP